LADQFQRQAVEGVIGRGGNVLLLQIGLRACDIGEAHRVATHLRLRLLGLELKVCAACHVEPAPEKGLVDLIVLDGEVVYQLRSAVNCAMKKLRAQFDSSLTSGANSNAMSLCSFKSVSSTLSVRMVPISASVNNRKLPSFMPIGT